MSVISTSDGVKVDVTAPVVAVPPAFSLDQLGSSNVVVNLPEIANGYQVHTYDKVHPCACVLWL